MFLGNFRVVSPRLLPTELALNMLEQSWGGTCTHVREGYNIGNPAYDLGPICRTRRVCHQPSWCGGVCRVSNSAGLRIPILECRRLELYQHSIHSKIALAS